MVDELVPEMRPAIRVPIDLQDGTKLQLVVMADGALLYRRAKIKVAMSQTEVRKGIMHRLITLNARADNRPTHTTVRGDSSERRSAIRPWTDSVFHVGTR